MKYQSTRAANEVNETDMLERGVTWYNLCTESCSMPPSMAAFENAAMAGTSETILSVGADGRLKL